MELDEVHYSLLRNSFTLVFGYRAIINSFCVRIRPRYSKLSQSSLKEYIKDIVDGRISD